MNWERVQTNQKKATKKWTGLALSFALASNMNLASKSSCFVLFILRVVKLLGCSAELQGGISSLKCLTSMSSAVFCKYLIPLWIQYCFKEMKYWFHSLMGHYLYFAYGKFKHRELKWPRLKELETEPKNPHPELSHIIYPITNLKIITQWYILKFGFYYFF